MKQPFRSRLHSSPRLSLNENKGAYDSCKEVQYTNNIGNTRKEVERCCWTALMVPCTVYYHHTIASVFNPKLLRFHEVCCCKVLEKDDEASLITTSCLQISFIDASRKKEVVVIQIEQQQQRR